MLTEVFENAFSVGHAEDNDLLTAKLIYQSDLN